MSWTFKWVEHCSEDSIIWAQEVWHTYFHGRRSTLSGFFCCTTLNQLKKSTLKKLLFHQPSIHSWNVDGRNASWLLSVPPISLSLPVITSVCCSLGIQITMLNNSFFFPFYLKRTRKRSLNAIKFQRLTSPLIFSPSPLIFFPQSSHFRGYALCIE